MRLIKLGVAAAAIGGALALTPAAAFAQSPPPSPSAPVENAGFCILSGSSLAGEVGTTYPPNAVSANGVLHVPRGGATGSPSVCGGPLLPGH